MAQQTLNNLDSAQVFRGKLNANFTDLYSNKATINHASSDTSYGLATNNLYGHLKVTSGNGLSLTNGLLTMSLGTTSTPGALQLVNNATTNDSTKAVTAAALYGLAQAGVQTYYGTTEPDASVGKNGDIYIKIAA